MRNKILCTIVMYLGLSLLAHGQTNNVSTRIDPDDWNQFIYTRAINEKDSLTFQYWAKRNKDQFARISWQRTTKLTKSIRLISSFGGQLLNNSAGLDFQTYAEVGLKTVVRKFNAASTLNFNISFRRPSVIKNVTTAQYRVNNNWAIGYRGENAKNSRNNWVENRNGVTLDYSINQKFSVGMWTYYNTKTNRVRNTYGFTAKF